MNSALWTSLKGLTFSAKLFYALMLGVFIAVLMRNSALYPSVFADEYTYSISSRILPYSQAAISNYLYLLTFRLTNICGDGFLSCARILNLVFFLDQFHLFTKSQRGFLIDQLPGGSVY